MVIIRIEANSIWLDLPTGTELLNKGIFKPTGCFRVNEIIFLLISQPIKHLKSLDRSYIFTESIAF